MPSAALRASQREAIIATVSLRKLAVVPVVLALAARVDAEEAPTHQPSDTDVAVVEDYRWVEAVGRRRQRIETTPQPVIVLGPDDMMLYPALTLADRLRTVGGVDVYQSRHGQYDVGMRGFNSTLNPRLLVTVGQVEFRQEEFGAILWRGVFMNSDIARVEILKGPGSVTYGSNAFGGVVAVREREPGMTHEIRTVASAGDPGAYEADGTAMGPLGHGFYYKVSAGGTHLDDLDGVRSGLPYLGNPRGAHTGGTDLESNRATGLLGVRLGESRLELGARWLDLSTWEMVDNLDSGSNNDPHRYRDLIGRAVGPWGEIVHTYRLASNSYENQKVSYDPTQDFRYTQGGTDNVENVTRAQTPLAMGDHTLLVGMEFRHWASESNLWNSTGRFNDRSTWSTVTTTQAGIFAEDQWSLSASWTFTAGVRADHHSRTGLNASPRVAVNFNPNANTSFLAALSHGYRNPTPIESFLSEFYYTSNENLAAEKITALELSVSHRIDDHNLIGANVFASRANDVIWIQSLDEATMEANYNRWLSEYSSGNFSQPLGPILQFTNLASPLITVGIELQAKAQVSDEWTLWANSTLQSSHYRDPVRLHSDGFISIDPATLQPARLFAYDRTFGSDINAPPRAQLNAGALWRHNGWFASGSGRAVSGRELFALSDSYLLRDREVAVKQVPAYACLDVAVGYRWGEEQYLRVVVMDVFDSQHLENSETAGAVLAKEVEDQQSSTLGRMIALQGAWRF